MTTLRRPTAHRLAAGAALAWLGLAGAAMAQPLQLPGAQPFNQPGAQQSAPASVGGQSSAPRPRTMPAIKIPGEDSLLGKTLRRNGGFGEATLEKTGSGYGLKLRAEGFQSSNLVEPCAISFGDTPVPVTSLGKPAGLPRYKLEAAACPIVFDVLDGAFLVTEPEQPCVIEAAACRIDPRGVWGPDVRTLPARAKETEAERSKAETAVREGYRALSAKANLTEQRTIAREQAGFSSERAQICRDFQREGSHGFCGARITEARAASIRARLGLPEPKPETAKPRPATARRAPPPAAAPAPTIQ
ncbi:hypothetical protein [Bosea sp. (in: a-proteobacteria)]|uniref:hypothetical protein n=1 Tax=Bosea sp. (in: a-proteobacteria) TaxID=1871050 RepID=UPI002DDD626D|nr:hypothetical protein [Bosea sp. (in: a-proteobacteria)]HEV2508857.1 hypothetical protein [Bosea sp. (in: a-proteobacteria)]